MRKKIKLVIPPPEYAIQSKNTAVLIDAEKSEEQTKLLNLKVLLDESAEDIKKHRVRPAENFFSEWDKK